MARRIAYIGEPVLTLEQVAFQCRLDPEDTVPELINGLIIPGVTAQAEERTGAGIQLAEYEEEWPAHFASGHSLDVGQVKSIVSIGQIMGDGSLQDLDVTHVLRHRDNESFLYFPDGRPPGDLVIRYQAGTDLDAHPSVRTWLLMQAATCHENRETLVIGVTLAELPSTMLDTLLAPITVPPRF